MEEVTGTESNRRTDTTESKKGRSYIDDAPRSLTIKPVKIVWACQGRHKRRKVNPRHVKVEEMHSCGSTTPQTVTEDYDIENDIVELFGGNGNLPIFASDSSTKELPRNDEIFNANVLASVYESGAETKGIVSEVLCPHSGVRFPTSPLHNEQSGVLITTFNMDGSFKKQKHFPIISMMNGYLDSLGMESQWKNPFDIWCLENIDAGDAVVCTSLGRTNFQSSHSRTKLLKLNTRNIVCDDKEIFHQVYESPMHEILLFPTLEKKLCLKLSLESAGPYDPYVISGIWESPEKGVCLSDTDFKLSNGGEDLLWKDANRIVWPEIRTYWKTVVHPEYSNIRISVSTPITFVLEIPHKREAGVVQAYGLEVNEEHKIVRVIENSVAHKAGMKKGDIIVALNGEKVNPPASLPQMFSLQSNGQTNISVTCRRNTRAEFDAEERKTIDERAKYLEDSKMERFRSIPCITARLLFSQDGIAVERDGVSMAFLPNKPTQRTAFIVRKYTPFYGVSFEEE